MKRILLLCGFLVAGAGLAAAQSSTNGRPVVPVRVVDSVSIEGVARAGAVVDSVFVDRLSTYGEVSPGDFGAYLLVRLGVEPFPNSLAWRVQADSGLIRIRGRFADIPEESKALFGNLLMFVDSSTTLEAEVRTAPAGEALARFRLTRILVNRVAVPDFLLTSIFTSVGRQYPALTESGRDLYLQVPADGRVRILPDRIVFERVAAAGQPTRPGQSGAPPPS